MKNLVRLAAGFGLSAFVTTPVWAFTPSSTPLQSSTSVPPNIMILLDDSGSMKEIVAGSNPPESRMEVARKVVKELIGRNRDKRFGLFTFDPDPPGANDQERDEGSRGKLVSDVMDISSPNNDTNYKDLLSKVDGISENGVGSYDIRTPLGKTFYEITRYFRGMSRWKAPGSGPYTSPIQYRCQKNFAIVVTDGDPTWDYDFPAPTEDSQGIVNGVFKLPSWDGVNDDGNWTSGSKKTGGVGELQYMDDYAKFAYDIDLKPDGQEVDHAEKSFNALGFEKQNLITYTVGYNNSSPMLKRAAEYGHGAYYLANNYQELTDTLSSVLANISAQTDSGGAGAANSGTLSTSSVYYSTRYQPKEESGSMAWYWSGSVDVYALDPVSGAPANSPSWSTDSTITSSNNSMTVYETYQPGSASPVVGLDYSQLSTAQRNGLDADAQTLSTNVNPPLTGSSLIQWAKGNNVTGLRERKVLLGDIMGASLVHASPGEALAGTTHGDTSYDDYLKNEKAVSMTSSLVVGANDGLLHVINASTGAHRYAYLPSPFLAELKHIASPSYDLSNHERLMDGPVTVADAQINQKWLTAAIAGMGGGGKGMVALRLFGGDGSNQDQVRALWEVKAPSTDTPADSWNDLGYTYAQASVARLADGRWAAIFGNGYGSYHGKAALYVVNLGDGSLIREIVVDDNSTGTPADIAQGSGLSSARQLVDGEFQLQSAYAGDLRGNLWKFDLSSNDPQNWSAAKLFSADVGHPITVRPQLMENPKGGRMVLFGTGKLLENDDKNDNTQQTFYGIWDKQSPTGLPTAAVAKSSLLQQAVDSASLAGNFFTVSANAIDWTTNDGWYIDMPVAGERVINDAALTRGRVVFPSLRLETQSTDPCEGADKGRIFALDALTGSALVSPVFDTNGDGVINSRDKTLAGGINLSTGTGGVTVVEGGSKDRLIWTTVGGGGEGGKPGSTGIPGGTTTFMKRIMWRQLQ